MSKYNGTMCPRGKLSVFIKCPGCGKITEILLWDDFRKEQFCECGAELIADLIVIYRKRKMK